MEDQVAIIYCATNGLLDEVPVNEVRTFEKEFQRTMNAQHRDVLDALRAGKLDDNDHRHHEQVASELSAAIKINKN